MNKTLLILLTFVSFMAQGQWTFNVVEMTDNIHHITHLEAERDCYLVDFQGVGVTDTFVSQYWLSYRDGELGITDVNNSKYPTSFYTWTGNGEPIRRPRVSNDRTYGFWWHRIPRTDNFNWVNCSE